MPPLEYGKLPQHLPSRSSVQVYMEGRHNIYLNFASRKSDVHVSQPRALGCPLGDRVYAHNEKVAGLVKGAPGLIRTKLLQCH